MNVTRYILRNINPLNLILLFLFITGAVIAYPDLNRTITVKLPEGVSTGEAERTGETGTAIPVISDYDVVGELNLFHPERKPPPPIDDEPEIVPAMMQPVDFVLYGTLVADDTNLAFVEERMARRRTAGGKKRISIMRVGDTLAGYTLKSIDPHKIVMVRDDEEITVLLYNPAQPRERQPGQQQRQQKFYQQR